MDKQPEPKEKFNLQHELSHLGTKQSEGNFEYYRLNDPERLLNQAALAGYLLHGSSRKLQELTPQTANDAHRESGNRTAIYMTSVPVVAMFSALRGGIALGWSQHSVDSEVEDGQITYKSLHFAAEHPEMLAGRGFVYVFGPDQADELVGNEHLSYSLQKPIATIAVDRNDFGYAVSDIQQPPRAN